MRKSNIKNFAGYEIERARYSIRERAFAEMWMKVNKQWSGRLTILQQLFTREYGTNDKRPPSKYRLIITDREQRIVATVIQWLGTNVGFSFLSDALNLAGFVIHSKNNPDYQHKLSRNYYQPFENLQNASAWYNHAADDARKNPLPAKIFKRPRPRRHLMRYVKFKEVCIRCGWVKTNNREAVCQPPKLKAKIKKIKSLQGKRSAGKYVY